MIWTLILSFNSSVWLHLTLYIAWEQSNIPQYSSMLACWDTLHLPAVIQGGKGWTEAKKSNSPTFSLLHLWVTIFNIPGGLQKVGEKFSSRLLSFPKVFPNSPNSSWDIWSWNLLKEKGFALLCWRSQVLLGGFFGYFQDLHHLSPNPSPIPACGPQIKPPSEATLGVRINTEGWACVI